MFLFKSPDPKFDDVETPVTDTNYQNLARASLDKVVDFVNSSGWKLLFKNINGVRIEEKRREGSGYTAIKTQKTLENVDVDGVVKCLFNPTFEERKRIYPDITHHNNTKEIDDNTVVSVTRFKTPPVIWDREFLGARFLRRDADGNCTISVVPINQEGHHDNKCVRGVASSDIIVNRLGENRVHVTSVNWIDPKGWVTPDIVQRYKEKSGDWLHQLEQTYRLTLKK